jgi:hypothetical protein
MKNIKRRDFLKTLSALSASRALPVGLSIGALTNKAHAASPDYGDVGVVAPTVMPQVINVFMYGGASELAGNLSNIADINANSVNDYTDNSAFTVRMLQSATDNLEANRSRFTDGQITANNFWKEAGGTHMEDMLAAGDMAVYRTIFKKKSATRSHRESIFMSHKGTTDIENTPGIGSRLALMLKANESTYTTVNTADGQPLGSLDALTLPFVSFEGDTQTYTQDPENTLPVYLRGLTMDDQFNNPYTRGGLGGSETAITDLLALRKTVIDADYEKYGKVKDALDGRADLEARMTNLAALTSAADLSVTYPNTNFARQIEAAVTLALHNPQTLYMAVGTPGLGGWDDHNNGVDDYPNRMNDLMAAIKAGMEHIRQANLQGITTIAGHARTQTNNIVINVFGDFGRLVNLNDSKGWDHANNQNLYTFGGAGVRPTKEAAAMGTIVGTTERAGTPKTNNQYTVPAEGSPTFEPMSIAASIYGYFGATKPELMTSNDRPLNDFL